MMLFHTPKKEIEPPLIKMNNIPVEVVDDFVYLGITLNKHLSWKPHINKISNKIAKVNGVLAKLKSFIPTKTLLTIYQSLIACHFNYGILLWGKQVDQISKMQKKSIRLITKAKYNAHTDPILKALALQKISDIRLTQELSFYCKFTKKTLPPYFLANFIKISERSRRRTLLHLPRFRHEYFRHNLRYSIAETINNCEASLIDKFSTHSWDSIKKQVKKQQISSYLTDCLVPNCYICGRNGTA
jgi:hypothetical protein